MWGRVLSEVDAPQSSPRGFAVAAEDEVVGGVVDMEGVFVEVRVAAGVAKFAEAEEVVGEGGHDVAGAGSWR